MPNKTKGTLIASGIFPPEIGGPASYAKTLATRLAQNGPAVVITYSSVWHSAKDKTLPFNVIRIWSKWPKGIKHLIYFFRAAVQARQFDAVVALNAVSAGIPARLAARLFKRKFVVKIVGDSAWERAINNGKTSLLLNDFQNSKRSGLIKLLHTLQFQVCKGAHKIIVPSKYLARIVEGWGIPADKITVIYNGTDFKPSVLNKEEARKKLKIPGNIILSAGRLVPWKGFRMLIKIMPKLGEINQFFRLIIVGSGSDRPNLESMIKNMGLERKVTLVGKKSQSDLADYMAAADMAILNSGYEGFSHQLLEFLASGVPVIASSAGGNKEVIRQGENGLMVKYNDEFNLIEAIRAIWTNDDLREKIILEGKKTVEQFSVERMFEETIALLKSL